MVCFRETQSVISSFIDEVETHIIYKKNTSVSYLPSDVMYYCVLQKML